MYRSLNTWNGGLNLNRHNPSPLSIANYMNANNANKSVYCQWQVFSLEGDRSSVKIDDNQSPLSPWKFIALLFKVVLHDIVKTVNLTTQLAAWTALRDTIQCKKGLWETWNAWNSVQMASPRTWTLMGRWFAKIHSQVRVIKLLVSCRLVVCPWGLAKRGCTSYAQKLSKKVLLF